MLRRENPAPPPAWPRLLCWEPGRCPAVRRLGAPSARREAAAGRGLWGSRGLIGRAALCACAPPSAGASRACAWHSPPFPIKAAAMRACPIQASRGAWPRPSCRRRRDGRSSSAAAAAFPPSLRLRSHVHGGLGRGGARLNGEAGGGLRKRFAARRQSVRAWTQEKRLRRRFSNSWHSRHTFHLNPDKAESLLITQPMG